MRPMHPAKRVEIIVEAVMERQICRALTEGGVTGYTVLPAMGGSGRSGAWSRDSNVSRLGGMIAVVCLIAPGRLEGLLVAIFPLLDAHVGAVSVTDTQILRAERF